MSDSFEEGLKSRFQLNDIEFGELMNLFCMSPSTDESPAEFLKSLDLAVDSASSKVRGSYRILEKEGVV